MVFGNNLAYIPRLLIPSEGIGITFAFVFFDRKSYLANFLLTYVFFKYLSNLGDKLMPFYSREPSRTDLVAAPGRGAEAWGRRPGQGEPSGTLLVVTPARGVWKNLFCIVGPRGSRPGRIWWRPPVMAQKPGAALQAKGTVRDGFGGNPRSWGRNLGPPSRPRGAVGDAFFGGNPWPWGVNLILYRRAVVGPRSWGRSVGNGFGGTLRSWSRSLGNIANVVDFEDVVDFVDQAGGRDLGHPGSIPSSEGGLSAVVRQRRRTKGRESRFPAAIPQKECAQAERRDFLVKSWPGAFWKQTSGTRGPLGWQSKSPSGTIGKRPFWAKSWSRALWRQISATLGPLGRQLKSPSETIGKRPFWAKSWPGTLWKQDSAIWGPLGWQSKSPSGTIGKRPLGQILVESALKANFGHLKAFGPATKIPFWDNWETAVLGQLLAGSPLEANFGNLRPLGR